MLSHAGGVCLLLGVTAVLVRRGVRVVVSTVGPLGLARRHAVLLFNLFNRSVFPLLRELFVGNFDDLLGRW